MSGTHFSAALDLLLGGFNIARMGWNGANMFIFYVPGSTFTVNREPLLAIFEEGTEIRYRPHIDLRASDGTIGMWNPSQTDLLATDWVVVDHDDISEMTAPPA